MKLTKKNRTHILGRLNSKLELEFLNIQKKQYGGYGIAVDKYVMFQRSIRFSCDVYIDQSSNNFSRFRTHHRQRERERMKNCQLSLFSLYSLFLNHSSDYL